MIMLTHVLLLLLFSNVPFCLSILKINPSDCQTGSYFDISHLTCLPCKNNKVPSSDRLSCVCQKDYKMISDKEEEEIKCQKCPSGQMATPDGWQCAECDDPCGSCSGRDVFNVRTTTGTLESQMKCAPCTSTTRPNAGGDRCVPCNLHTEGNGVDCTCESPNTRLGGLCFQPKHLADVSNSPSMSAVLFQGGLRQESWYFKEHLRAAVAMCKVGPKSLRNDSLMLMSNLCVLLHYNRDSGPRGGEGACDAYSKLSSGNNQQSEWPTNMPQLYYLLGEPNSILHKLDIDAHFSFDPSTPMSTLQLVMAAYALNGTYLGLVPALGGLLQLCKNEERVVDAAYKFGRKYKQPCEINVKSFWYSYEPVFFDVYLQYPTPGNEKTMQLYPIPVLNLNFENNGALVNTDDQPGRWTLTRRIFLVDNVSGKESALNSTAKVVRYLEYIGINVELQTTKDGRIFPPYLRVKYNEAKLEKLEQDARVQIIFETNYYMSTVRHEKDIEITMGTLCSVAFLWAALKTWSWSRRSGKAAVDFVTIVKGIIFLGVSIANVFLIVLIAMCLWILVVYKKQRTPVLMMPTFDQEYSFTVYLGLAAAIKLIEMIHAIIEQVTIQVFFLDWERPRGYIIPRNGETVGQDPTKTPSPVTIWRTYFVGNEWNELQGYRKTSYVFQLFAMIFFLKVLNFESLALIEPDSTMYNVPKEYVDSRMSRFAVASTLYLSIGFFQWFANVFIVERCIVDHFRSFVDLCSISNISVLVLLHRQFGYYIHGRSVHGHADTDMKEMNEMLQRERDNLCSHRGLESNSEQQTFIACFPHKFRVQFDRVLSLLKNPNRAETRLTGTDQATVRTNGVIDVYEQMNTFLTSFVDHVAVEADYIVKDRTMLESVFDMEFQDTNQKGVFYRDPSDSSFARALTYGNEWTHLSFDLLLFCIIDLIAHNFLIAAVVSYLILATMKMFRKSGVRKNLTKSSLVDERFLI